jgi:hypothetical protein
LLLFPLLAFRVEFTTELGLDLFDSFNDLFFGGLANGTLFCDACAYFLGALLQLGE